VEFVLIHACTTKLVFFALGTVLNLAFALSVLGFLIMHMSLVAGNTTTIEVFLATIPFSSHHVLPVSFSVDSAYGRTCGDNYTSHFLFQYVKLQRYSIGIWCVSLIMLWCHTL
jgi:hypothetical protein